MKPTTIMKYIKQRNKYQQQHARSGTSSSSGLFEGRRGGGRRGRGREIMSTTSASASAEQAEEEEDVSTSESATANTPSITTDDGCNNIMASPYNYVFTDETIDELDGRNHFDDHYHHDSPEFILKIGQVIRQTKRALDDNCMVTAGSRGISNNHHHHHIVPILATTGSSTTCSTSQQSGFSSQQTISDAGAIYSGASILADEEEEEKSQQEQEQQQQELTRQSSTSTLDAVVECVKNGICLLTPTSKTTIPDEPELLVHEDMNHDSSYLGTDAAVVFECPEITEEEDNLMHHYHTSFPPSKRNQSSTPPPATIFRPTMSSVMGIEVRLKPIADDAESSAITSESSETTTTTATKAATTPVTTTSKSKSVDDQDTKSHTLSISEFLEIQNSNSNMIDDEMNSATDGGVVLQPSIVPPPRPAPATTTTTRHVKEEKNKEEEQKQKLMMNKSNRSCQQDHKKHHVAPIKPHSRDSFHVPWQSSIRRKLWNKKGEC